MNISNYYFHTISKDKTGKEVYDDFESILRDGKLKSQKLLNNNATKFNGLNYISLASYVRESEYKTFILDEKNYSTSELSKMFGTYDEYLKKLKLNEWLETPMNIQDFFRINNTDEKIEYYNYLESISRTYPVDVRYLYKSTGNLIYRYILDMIKGDIVYCNKTEYSFEKYIRNSKGITFIFTKEIEIVDVQIIPNLPFEIENELVKKIENLSARYSNQIGEVQVKDYLDINNIVGILINDRISKECVLNIMKKYNLNVKLYRLIDNKLVES